MFRDIDFYYFDVQKHDSFYLTYTYANIQTRKYTLNSIQIYLFNYNW